MHPNSRKQPKHEFRVQWGRIGWVWCEKFWRDFVARTFAPVLPVLRRVRQPNSPKCSQIEQNTKNKSLESNSEDWVRSLRKIHTRLGSSNICTCRLVLHRVFVIQPNGPKCTKLVWNAPEHEFRVPNAPMRSLRKISTRLRGTNFCTSLTRFA